ncbi:MAG: 8-oxo-dGTP diphosphatase [Lachnospiraceae bacterium]|nr:8-oxo-dGTP diphosphatase [Lachnospiraceae bacterium]
MLLTTLCYLEKDGRYLMMHRTKKEHDINKDKWIGVGGKFEDKESPEDCLLRETMEETGLRLTDYRFRGIVTFVTDRYETEFMHLFSAYAWEREGGSSAGEGPDGVIPCREGVLEWLDMDKVYDLELWEGDRIFFRLMQDEAPFFSLKLEYTGDELTAYALDGEYHRQSYPHQNMYEEFLRSRRAKAK